MRAGDGAGDWFAGGGLSPDILEFLVPRKLPPIGEAAISGMKAGAVGSAVAWTLLLGVYAGSGGDGLLPAKMLAYRLWDDAGLASGPLGFALGTLLCLAGGAGFGALFGVIMARLVGCVGVFTAIGVGAIYGVLVWIVTHYVLLAFIAPDLLQIWNQETVALCAVAYGVCLGLFGDAYRTLPRLGSRAG